MFEFEENLGISAKIKVVGVGGGGGNAIKTMMKERIAGVDFVAINTDVQSLKENEAMVKIQIGSKLTRGLGSGANPQVGRDAAIEDSQLISETLLGSDMVFITAGMGGGTGTGAVPVIAKIARDLGILTVCVVTRPFSFEGRKRMRQAETGIVALKEAADTIICIPNDNMLNLAGKDTPIVDSFKMVDYVLLQAVRGIADLITTPGLINLDFADIRTVMKDAGLALMGTGIASGESRALEAARAAIRSPLLENLSISGATGILLNVRGSSDMTLFEVNEASKLIQQECHEDANIIFGTVIDEEMRDSIRITVMATGFDGEFAQMRQSVLQERARDAVRPFVGEIARQTQQQAVPSRSEPAREAVRPQEARPASPRPSGGSLREIFEDMQKPAAAPLQVGLFDDAVKSKKRDETPFSGPLTLDTTNAYASDAEEDGFGEAGDIASQLVQGGRRGFGDAAKTQRRFDAPDAGKWDEAALFGKKPASTWGVPTTEEVSGGRSQEARSMAPRVTRRPTGNVVEEKADYKKIMNDFGLNDSEADEYDIPAFIRRKPD
jgi:cell division protein FtsZ